MFLVFNFKISLKKNIFSKIVLSLVNKLSCLNQGRNMPRSRTILKWKKGTTGEGLFHTGKCCYVLLASILDTENISDGLS